MVKFKPVVIFGVAGIIALITTLVIYSSIQKRLRIEKGPGVQVQPIAIATVDITWGKKVIKEMVSMKPYLKSSLPAGAFTDLGSLVGRVVISPVRAQEPLLESRLAPPNIRSGEVAAILSEKKRAVAVRVDKVIGVAGFIHPGNRVDVLVTISKRNMEQPITKIILENVLVLAAGSKVDAVKEKEEKASVVDVITLEVTPEETEKLALAATEGKLQLALRGLTDTAEALTKGTSIPMLLASYTWPQPQRKTPKTSVVRPKPKPKPKPALFVVELIQGGKITSLKFEGK